MVGARVGESFADFGVSPEVIPEFVDGLNDSDIHSHELLVKGCGGNIVRVDATVINGNAGHHEAGGVAGANSRSAENGCGWNSCRRNCA